MTNSQEFIQLFREHLDHARPVGKGCQWRVEIPLDLAASQGQGAVKTVLRHEVKLLMKPGDYVFALAVHDEVGDATSYLQEKFVVAKPGAPAAKTKKEKAK